MTTVVPWVLVAWVIVSVPTSLWVSSLLHQRRSPHRLASKTASARAEARAP
jgi:hypothetical protein